MRAGRSRYFVATSLVLLVLTLIAFSDNLFTNVGQPSNADPKFIVHGLFCGAWMVLLLVQSWLAGQGSIALHRRLGLAGMAVALGVTLSTIWVFIVVWKDWALMSPEVRANRLLLPSFALCVAAAYVTRRRPDRHKRLLMLGTFFMLEPVLARVYDPAFVPLLPGASTAFIDALFIPWLFALWLGFFASLLIHDWRTLHRLHPISLAGLGWFGLVWAVVLLS